MPTVDAINRTSTRLYKHQQYNTVLPSLYNIDVAR